MLSGRQERSQPRPLPGEGLPELGTPTSPLQCSPFAVTCAIEQDRATGKGDLEPEPTV